MNIFPIGTVSSSSSDGTIQSVSYGLFEPNSKVISKKQYANLITAFQNQTLLTRKKAEPVLLIQYNYENIFTKEFRQIEHFIDNIGEESLNSFYAVDWSKGQTPSSITDSSGDWVVAIDSTFLYSTIANQKADHALIWDASNWKEGSITSISANTSVTVDVDTNDYGALTLTNANSRGMIYPLYQCYLVPGTLETFDTGGFVWGKDADLNGIGGYVYSGSISFITKHKI